MKTNKIINAILFVTVLITLTAVMSICTYASSVLTLNLGNDFVLSTPSPTPKPKSTKELRKLQLIGLDESLTIKTFDETFVFTGNTEGGALVTVAVAVKNANGEYEDIKTYQQTASVLGVFSVSAALPEGESLITVSAKLDDRYSELVIDVKRKSADIRNELLTGRSLPGSLLIR